MRARRVHRSKNDRARNGRTERVTDSRRTPRSSDRGHSSGASWPRSPREIAPPGGRFFLAAEFAGKQCAVARRSRAPRSPSCVLFVSASPFACCLRRRGPGPEAGDQVHPCALSCGTQVWRRKDREPVRTGSRKRMDRTDLAGRWSLGRPVARPKPDAAPRGKQRGPANAGPRDAPPEGVAATTVRNLALTVH
jgi:hypothetical protein